jgi:hypothetical protein
MLTLSGFSPPHSAAERRQIVTPLQSDGEVHQAQEGDFRKEKSYFCFSKSALGDVSCVPWRRTFIYIPAPRDWPPSLQFCGGGHQSWSNPMSGCLDSLPNSSLFGRVQSLNMNASEVRKRQVGHNLSSAQKRAVGKHRVYY